MKSLTPVMQAAINWMERDPDKRIVRFPGGFWIVLTEGQRESFGTKTIQALANRDIVEYTEWHKGRNGRFPIAARLRSPERRT
jgi:hypothetical protein